MTGLSQTLCALATSAYTEGKRWSERRHWAALEIINHFQETIHE